jgi:hypothetical protein
MWRHDLQWTWMADGLKDIVTGKRFWSHGHEGDPTATMPLHHASTKLVACPEECRNSSPTS